MMSVLLIGCCCPVIPGALLSRPSIVKLFERTRMPFEEKFVPKAKRSWPLPSALTPGAESASANTSRNVSPCTDSALRHNR